MARFAPVAPIQLLEQMTRAEDQVFGDYHLLLSHDIMESEEKQRRFKDLFDWETSTKGKWKNTVIIDNSVVELGGAVDMKMVFAAADVVDTKIVVIPDVMGDAKETVESLHKTMQSLSQVERLRYRFMFVPQGPTLEAFTWALMEAATYEAYVTWIGIPRIAVKQLGTRAQLIELAKILMPFAHIHLLGFSDNVIDDIMCARMQSVTGIDSAVPVRAGIYGLPFVPYVSDYGKRKDADTGMDYWNAPKLTLEAIQNIVNIRKWIKRV